MRIIKFRGKSISGKRLGEWVHGAYLPDFDGYTHRTLIVDCITGFSEEVDPITIGQFTGLLDRNGKEIYEGDIVQLDYITTIGKHRIGLLFEVRWCTQEGCWVGWDGFTGNTLQQTNKMFVVKGNIYDNPELINE
ncbi:YopX family protein [Bacteroides sp.]|uniref:YopX family protein n=1 Tax=Bacteroides sp. TaxID=29523 RepID=UPI0025C41A4A|nr:YopX family protein [Bacteroides sp.]